MKTMGSIESVLKDNGYKLTEQRKLIIEVFEEKNGPHTAQEIFDRVKLKNNKIDFSTIYRNLELLSSLNIINKLMISSGVSHFVLQGRRHHHHMICKGCGEMKEIDVCPFSEFEDELRASGFEPTEHRFEIYGYCSKCSCGKD